MSFIALTLAIFAQATAASPQVASSENGDPTRAETWEIAYDIAMTPYIEDYRRCLNYGHRVASGVADFEEQHRSDLPRCADELEEAIEASNAALERRGRSDIMTPDMVARVFAHQGEIHIGRGRNIDQQFTRQIASYEAKQKVLDEQFNAADQ